MSDTESIMEQRGIKPTANRILVTKALAGASGPVSLPELEIMLDPMDKSSIFRVLTLFVSKDLVHEIEDGSGMMKYELCEGGEHGHAAADMHTHFYCERCGKTFCFKDIKIPGVDLPRGFMTHSINYMVKGLCPSCAAKATCTE